MQPRQPRVFACLLLAASVQQPQCTSLPSVSLVPLVPLVPSVPLPHQHGNLIDSSGTILARHPASPTFVLSCRVWSCLVLILPLLGSLFSVIMDVKKKHEIEAALAHEAQAISSGQLKEENPLDLSDDFRIFCEACRRGDLKVRHHPCRQKKGQD